MTTRTVDQRLHAMSCDTSTEKILLKYRFVSAAKYAALIEFFAKYCSMDKRLIARGQPWRSLSQPDAEKMNYQDTRLHTERDFNRQLLCLRF